MAQVSEIKGSKAVKVARPKTVKVGYATYRIEWLDENEWLKLHRNNDDCNGVTESDYHLIQLRDNNRPEAHMRECLLHEMMHAAWAIAGIHQFHENMEGEDREEFLVGQLSPLLLQVLNDNPNIVAYLLLDNTVSE